MEESGFPQITFLGQAGFLIVNSNNKRLAIDPYFSNCVADVENDYIGYKRLLPQLFKAEEMNLDVLVCTHFHRDHYDKDSVSTLTKFGAKLFCPKDCENDVIEDKVKNYSIVSHGSSFTNSGFTLRFVNCDHGNSAPDAVGVIIETDNIRILEVGDTCLRLDRVDEYLQYGDIDVLIGPINGHYGNMNEDEFVKLGKAINPKVTIPCHYGMFLRHGGDVESFCKEAQTKELNYLVMKQGDVATLNQR